MTRTNQIAFGLGLMFLGLVFGVAQVATNDVGLTNPSAFPIYAIFASVGLVSGLLLGAEVDRTIDWSAWQTMERMWEGLFPSESQVVASLKDGQSAPVSIVELRLRKDLGLESRAWVRLYSRGRDVYGHRNVAYRPVSYRVVGTTRIGELMKAVGDAYETELPQCEARFFEHRSRKQIHGNTQFSNLPVV